MRKIVANNIEYDLIEYSNWSLIRDVINFIRPYKSRFFAATFLRLSSDIAALYPTYAFAVIVTFFSKYAPGDSLKYFWTVLLLWTEASLWRSLAKNSGKYIGYQLAERISLDGQLKTIQHLFLLDIAWHEKENAGNRLKRIQKGGDGLERVMRMWINNFIEIGVNFVGMIFIFGKIDLLIGGVMVIFLAVYLSISLLMLSKASAASQAVDIKEEEMTGLMFQAISNIRSVKVLAMGGAILKMIHEQSVELFKKIRERVFRFQIRNITIDVIGQTFRIGTIAFIAYGIAHGRYEVGFLILFNGYFSSIWESVNELSETTQDLIICKYGIARMQRTINEPILIDNEKNKADLPKNWKKIIVKNLSFSYGKNKVLNNISFEIKRGERVGIIGLSGAGKSTLFKLMLKENEDFTGDILFDDVSIRKIKKKAYFDNVGVVLQDTEVFNFTLRENIEIASSKKHKKEDLEQALNISYVSDFIHKLPLGVDTFIGEKGIKLSGGERQRLGVARAVYKQPQILFLDEATSHLDLESEEKIKDSLHKFFQKVTAVVIAHRLTTIREMDKIIVIEKGRIVEIGSFDELYGAGGRLFELWEKQKFN